MLRYRFAHPIRIGEDVVVPEAEDAIAIGFNDRGSISIDPLVMLSTVSFDHELVAMRREIDAVLADIHLPPETSFRKAGAQQIPQCCFRFGRSGPRCSGPLGGPRWWNPLHGDAPSTTVTATQPSPIKGEG